MNDKNIIEQFFKINAMLHRHHHQKGRVHFESVHRGQGRVLSLLKMQPEITQKDLSYLLDMRSQSLGELLMKLERNGLITRIPLESDRRIMNIKLTEEGIKAANHTEQEKADPKRKFDCLDDKEQEKLSEFLERIIKELEEKSGDCEMQEHRPDHERHGQCHHRGRGHGQRSFEDTHGDNPLRRQ